MTLLDVHTHIGASDPDGFRSSPSALLDALERAAARAVVFPMHEPDGYPAANDRVIESATESGGRLIPFCRVDPANGAAREAERALGAGARGIKLHPRAEGFVLSDARVAEIVALAAERRVPTIVHAGRGIPALGRDALELAERFSSANLILAHAGISDLAWIWRHVAGLPNLLFDTTWWNPVDLLALFALVPPGQIVYGSDAPYGTPVQAAILTLRCALQSGLAGEQIRAVMGEQATRLLDGEPPLDLGPPPGPARLDADLLLERAFVQLSMASARLLHGESATQELALARLACEVGEGAPQAAVCRSILALLDRAEHDPGDRDARRPQAPGTHLLVTATGVAKTPAVALPADPEPVNVGRREPGPAR